MGWPPPGWWWTGSGNSRRAMMTRRPSRAAMPIWTRCSPPLSRSAAANCPCRHGANRGPTMPVIVLKTLVRAAPSRCFDLARDVELHQRSTAASGERAVGGVTSGLLGPGDEVTWEATHFGVRQRLTSRVTEFEPPRRFVDEMVRGAFRRFRHEHQFLAVDGGTAMLVTFDYTSPLGPLGRLADTLFLRQYMSQLLRRRNAYLKSEAESASPWG